MLADKADTVEGATTPDEKSNQSDCARHSIQSTKSRVAYLWRLLLLQRLERPDCRQHLQTENFECVIIIVSCIVQICHDFEQMNDWLTLRSLRSLVTLSAYTHGERTRGQDQTKS